jgi:transcriptional regulator of acetoin/glycerol metabolism
VFAVEHWCVAVHDWVCYAAPVLGPSGDPVGVIHLSTTWSRANALGLPTVTALAHLVELQLRSRLDGGLPGPGLRLRVLGQPWVLFLLQEGKEPVERAVSLVDRGAGVAVLDQVGEEGLGMTALELVGASSSVLAALQIRGELLDRQTVGPDGPWRAVLRPERAPESS